MTNAQTQATARPGADTEPTVFIVDDDEAMRKSLAFLMQTAGLRAVAFESAEAFLSHYEPPMRGCILLDVRMPGMTGLELQQLLTSRAINTPVIILTAFADVTMAVRAMHAGAFEFFEKPFDSKRLLSRVRNAMDQDAKQSRQEQEIAEIRQKLDRLTPREHEVMELIVSGILNKEAAAMLKISVKTVENHRARVMEKMEAEYLADLVRMAMLAGVI